MPHEAFHGRSSAQRRLIAEVTDALPGTFTAEELLRAVREREPRVGAATVYRALGAMAESGWLEAVGARDGATVYARCRSAEHHHHLVCTSCGAVVELPCELGRALDAAARKSGYVVTGHDLAVRGVCGPCREREAG